MMMMMMVLTQKCRKHTVRMYVRTVRTTSVYVGVGRQSIDFEVPIKVSSDLCTTLFPIISNRSAETVATENCGLRLPKRFLKVSLYWVSFHLVRVPILLPRLFEWWNNSSTGPSVGTWSRLPNVEPHPFPFYVCRFPAAASVCTDANIRNGEYVRTSVRTFKWSTYGSLERKDLTVLDVRISILWSGSAFLPLNAPC